MNPRRLLARAQTSPESLRFSELVALAEAFGFELERTSGSHHIFRHPTARQLLNCQSERGKAKGYQVRQPLRMVRNSGLALKGGDA